MALHDDRTFVRHFSWLLLGIAVATIVFIIISFVVVAASGIASHSGYSYVQYMKAHPGAAAPGSASRAQAQAAPANPGAVAKNAGSAQAAGAVAASGNAGVKPDGHAIWQAHCSVCHATGVAGAPKIGDKQAWGPILSKTDMATLYDHAINGFKGDLGFMPPRGGAASLSDAQVKAAVDYMVGKSGGKPGQS